MANNMRLCGLGSIWPGRQHLRAIFGKERGGFRHHCCLGGWVEHRGRRGPSGNRYSERQEELVQPGGRVDAEQPHRVPGRVGEGMGRVGRDVDGFTLSHDFFFAPKAEFDLALENRERFLEIVAMRRRTAARRDVHVDQAITAICVFARNQNRIGVTHDSDVGKVLVFVRARKRKIASKIVRWNR